MARNKNNLREEIEQMVAIANLYYDGGCSQQEIATALGISRPAVSRLLARAREERIVTISILDPFNINQGLADKLCLEAGLSAAIVTPAIPNSPELNLRLVGISAARFIEKKIKTDEVVGIGWGRTLYSVGQSLEKQSTKGVTFAPLTGGLGQISPQFQVNELIRIFSKFFNGQPKQFFLPALVQDDETKTSLMETVDSKGITTIWENLTSALVGIGNVDFETELKMLFVNYVDQDTRQRLMASEAVGDICMQFFDQNGQDIKDGLRGVIGISLDQLRKVPNVIAISTGENKVPAILGAIRGKIIKTLITDELTAETILLKLKEDRK